MAHVRYWSIAAGLALVALLCGCASGDGTEASSPGGGASTPAAAGYWTHGKLLAAQPAREWPLSALPSPGATPSAHNPLLAPRVGATPYGVWTPRKLLVAPQWASSSDPDVDVGFVLLQPLDGKNIEDVIGANRIGFDAGFEHLVRVTGYPASADAPVTCINRTSQQSARQVKFECGGFFGGTSGSPWLTSFNAQTRTGTIVGVIGGYQEGGDTDAISYSAYLNGDIRQLYDQAVAT